MKPYYEQDGITLYHGDCREIYPWAVADVLVTDPPYGMRYRSGRVRGATAIAGDASTGIRDEILRAWAGRPALVFGTWKAPRPEKVRQVLIWDKRGGQGYSGDLDMPWADVTEEIYVLGDGWQGSRRPNIYSIPSYNSQAKARPEHPTPKPVRLLQELLGVCPPGVVGDPFAGGGATLLAARAQGLRCIGVEIEERYCEVIASRLSQGDLFGGVA